MSSRMIDWSKPIEIRDSVSQPWHHVTFLGYDPGTRTLAVIDGGYRKLLDLRCEPPESMQASHFVRNVPEKIVKRVYLYPNEHVSTENMKFLSNPPQGPVASVDVEFTPGKFAEDE